ncbi:MAG TPA: hypothetical protein VH186_23585 [Chloroflexia bacterium]|nr:hypothetical protein [Chloroflexia bacterium]
MSKAHQRSFLSLIWLVMLPLGLVACSGSESASPTVAGTPATTSKSELSTPATTLISNTMGATLTGNDLTAQTTVPGSRTPAPVASSPATPPVKGELAYGLLADNRLVALREDGSVFATLHPGNVPPGTITRIPGHYLALSPDKKILYALISGWTDEPDRVAVIEASTAQVKAIYPLARSQGKFIGFAIPGGVYRSLAVGPVTGRLYLFGNRDGTAIITTLNPANGSELASWTARERDGYNWLVYQGEVTPDEQQLYVSYHGDNTGGIDRFELSNSGLVRCPQTRRGWGCIGSHGSFAFYGGNLLVTYGYNVVVAEDNSGKALYGFDTGLTGTHLTEFAIDPKAQKLYAVNSCLVQPEMQGGFSAVNLTNPLQSSVPGEQEWVTPGPAPDLLIIPAPPRTPAANLPCGERLALGSNDLLLVAKITAPPYVIRAATTGALQIVDPRTGKILHNSGTPSAPLDVLFAPS